MYITPNSIPSILRDMYISLPFTIVARPDTANCFGASSCRVIGAYRSVQVL